MNYIQQKSHDTSTLFRKGILIDIVLKSSILFSFLGLIALYQSQSRILVFSIILTIISALLIGIQVVYFKQIKGIDDPTMDTRSLLEKKISYYYQSFRKAIYIMAVSNPLLVLSGFMYYFYIKYGTIKPMDSIDLLVSGSALALSLVISLAAQFGQYRFHINQIESSLHDLDQYSLDREKIQTRKRQRWYFIMMTLIALILGLLIFAYLFIS